MEFFCKQNLKLNYGFNLQKKPTRFGGLAEINELKWLKFYWN